MDMMCTRCKKRFAVVFMTRLDGDKTINEGLCLKCAKELGLKPVSDLMEKMGISDDDLENMSEQMMDIFGGDGDSGFEMGGAQALPFLQNIFGQRCGWDGSGSEAVCGISDPGIYPH